MNRRDFLKSAGIMAGVMYTDLPAFAQKVSHMGEARLRIGILSDIHIAYDDSVKVFKHALEYFRDRNVDGVMIAGDMADWGLERQLRAVAETWFAVFPKDKRPDGMKVERLFVYGNHDMEGVNYHGHREIGMTDAEAEADAIGPRHAKLWKKYFHEDFVPAYIKTVRGYHFVGSHWHSWQESPAAVQLLSEKEALLKGDKPFFYFQHAHPKNTCYGEWAWGQDNGDVTAALSRFPNAVAFSGHSHMPLTNDLDLWQGAFTSIGTSSLSYTYLLGGRENSEVDGDKRPIPAQMPPISGRDGKQGMLMTVYDSHITLERREFLYDQPLGDNWVIELPLSKTAPMSFENRAKTAAVPQFKKGDTISVSLQQGKDRYGKEEAQVAVSFPSVLKKTHGVRANDYEVQVEQRYVDLVNVVGSKRVYSRGCYLGENNDEADVVCLFAERELPEYFDYRFAVRPCECFGKKGEPIYSEWQKAKK